MTTFVRQAINDYLDAISKVYGPEYEAKMVVTFGGGHYVHIKHPDTVEGEAVPIGHLEMMTKDLLAKAEMRKAA